MVQAQSSLLLLLLYGSSPVLPATAISLLFKPSPLCCAYRPLTQTLCVQTMDKLELLLLLLCAYRLLTQTL